jgi:hypothetical protein
VNGPNIHNGKGGYTSDVSQRGLLVSTIHVMLTSLYERTLCSRKGLHLNTMYARHTYAVTQTPLIHCVNPHSRSTRSEVESSGSWDDVGFSNMRAMEGVLLALRLGIPCFYMTRLIEAFMIVGLNPILYDAQVSGARGTLLLL